MKYLRNGIIGIGVFAMILSFSGLVFAEMGHGMHKGGKMNKETCTVQIKVLRDSATALQASNPTLAKGLIDLADKRAEKMQKMQEWQDQHAAKMNLLKDSASALKTSNPTLSQELKKMSERKSMEEEAEEEAEE
jgi:gas vesicle protein